MWRDPFGASASDDSKIGDLRFIFFISALCSSMNFIGLGIGPPFAGWLSDQFNQYFISQGLDAATASAQGLQWSMRLMPLFALWGAVHYFLAARTLRAESLKE